MFVPATEELVAGEIRVTVLGSGDPGSDAAGVEYMLESGTSSYLRDPDGARVGLIADPGGEM
jgi:hypothetical protein